MGDEDSVDAIVGRAMEPEVAPQAIPEGAPDASVPTEQVTVTETGSNQDGNRTIIHKGKEISMDDPSYRDYAMKGKDYEAKMQSLNKDQHQMRVDRKLFDQEQGKNKERHDYLSQLDDYAKQNPAWEQMLQQQWAQIQAGNVPEMNPQTEIQTLNARLTQLQESVNSQNETIENRRVAEMEASQEGAIGKYKDSYPDQDWNTKDGDGNTLEDRIGHAMLDKGVRDFQIMADSFLLKEHLARTALQGKESAANGIQKAHKLGLGKITKESQIGLQKTVDISKKSYDDLTREAFDELGIAYE